MTLRPPRALTALTLALAALPGCYVARQSVGQITMLTHREPIARVLQEPDLPPAMRERLVLVWYAKHYAEDVIGLRHSESYEHVVRLSRNATSYVVSAAPPDSLRPYLWSFPIAGRLPYIGYFDRADAQRERDRLVAEGYDVWIRPVDAYSLGGWFPDPLYSPMLDDSRWSLADTVIHEMTHGTVFVPGNAAFNEGLATFVGDHGVLAFLEQRYGPRSHVLAEARAALADQRLYAEFLDGLIAELQALYGSDLPRAEKLARRREVFARARQRAASIPFETQGYARLAQMEINNAFLGTHSTYFGLQDKFARVFVRLGGDLRRFVDLMRTDVSHQRDPEAYLDTWLTAHPDPNAAVAAASPAH